MRYTRDQQPVSWFWYRVTETEIVGGTWAKRMSRFLGTYSGPR